jgi:hypothetical protein
VSVEQSMGDSDAEILVALYYRKWHSFVGTHKCIQIIFVDFKTNEYNFVFFGWVRKLTNIWVV